MEYTEKQCRELLSQSIKRYRKELGYSQLDLSVELKISLTFMRDIENGTKWVSPKTLAGIANALKVEPYELLKPEETYTEALHPEVSAEVTKYLNAIDDMLTKRLIPSILPTVERSITRIERSVKKLRKNFEKGDTGDK